MGTMGWPAGPAISKRFKPTPIDSDPNKIQFELRYFPLCAKGLGPALVAEHSGLLWAGNATVGFNSATDWAALKPQAPFGQMPLLTVPAASAWTSSPFARAGDEGRTHIGQTVAIINYIGKVSGTEGETAEAFATSQQLLAEGEDLFNMAVKCLPTLFKRLSDPAAGINTTKGTAADYNQFWSTSLPNHLTRLSRLCRGGSFQPPARATSPHLPGELYLWSVLYQFHLIDSSVFASFKDLGEWFERIRNDPATQRVTSGSSPMGELRQYFLSIDSPEICLLGDERE
uniref:GST N-terminal domain-containing protein n=1 Tax=Strombidinopsis acuminata TaxID=141414 RepID=A0A7S3WH74_9SPIT